MSISSSINNNPLPLFRPQPYRPPVTPPPPPPIIRRQHTSQSDTGLSDRICAHPSLPYNVSFPRLTSNSAITTISGGTSPTNSQTTLHHASSMPMTTDFSLSTSIVSNTTRPSNESNHVKFSYSPISPSSTSSSPKPPISPPPPPPLLSTSPSSNRIETMDRQPPRFSRISSRPSLAAMRRVVSYHSSRRERSENTESECEAVVAARRTATATQSDWTKRRAQFVKDRQDDNEIVLQGYCRIPRFAKFRKTRFLRLVRRQLECFDSRVRKLLWSVVLDGARVRIQTKQHKITLSKLQCGYLIEFFVYDEQSCKDWAAALLRASMLATLQRS